MIRGLDLHKNPLFVCRHKVESDLIHEKANAKIGCNLAYLKNEVELKTENCGLFVVTRDLIMKALKKGVIASIGQTFSVRFVCLELLTEN